MWLLRNSGTTLAEPCPPSTASSGHDGVYSRCQKIARKATHALDYRSEYRLRSTRTAGNDLGWPWSSFVPRMHRTTPLAATQTLRKTHPAVTPTWLPASSVSAKRLLKGKFNSPGGALLKQLGQPRVQADRNFLLLQCLTTETDPITLGQPRGA